MEILFSLALLLAFHAYFGYPLSLLLLRRFGSRAVRRAAFQPPLTLIIAVHNEERRIRQKLLNSLSLSYPAGRLQILVASDGSTDLTNRIVKEFREQGVQLLRIEKRSGKESAQKAALERLSPEMVTAENLAGEKISAKLTRAPFNDAAIGGLKVVTENGWFAARPSGTEDIYKIYAESFRGNDHLQLIFGEAQEIVAAAFKEAGL